MTTYFKSPFKRKKVRGFTLIDKAIYIGCTYAMTQNNESTLECKEKVFDLNF